MNKIKINFKVNNVSLEKEINANVILADFIRYDLKLTGTHIGCDTSQCGSCIVMIDDKCIKSCSVLLAQCNNKKITTVEGIGKDDNLHGIQKAFKNNHGLQCGFCTPGILFSALELSKDKNIKTDFQIRQFLDGNLCRCTGYHNIIKAIKNYLKDSTNEKI